MRMRRSRRTLTAADNTAFDPEIRELAGANANEAKFGSWFAYETTPRANIFRRGAPGVNRCN
jgi:hypothetical protein